MFNFLMDFSSYSKLLVPAALLSKGHRVRPRPCCGTCTVISMVMWSLLAHLPPAPAHLREVGMEALEAIGGAPGGCAASPLLPPLPSHFTSALGLP